MKPGHPRFALAAVVAFVLGVGLMIPFDSTLTRLLGVISLAAFVFCGLAAVAEPRFLAADRDGDD